MGVFFPWDVYCMVLREIGLSRNTIRMFAKTFEDILKIIIFIKTMTILFSYYFQGKIGLSFYFALDYNE